MAAFQLLAQTRFHGEKKDYLHEDVKRGCLGGFQAGVEVGGYFGMSVRSAIHLRVSEADGGPRDSCRYSLPVTGFGKRLVTHL